ncbi:hypothetical protein Tco_0496204 [Tanacetum coccineum]
MVLVHDRLYGIPPPFLTIRTVLAFMQGSGFACLLSITSKNSHLSGPCFLVFDSVVLAYRKASEAADQAFDLLQVNSVPSGLVSINPAPDPSIHDDPSVNSVHGSCGISVAGVSGKFSSGFSMRKSARICPFTDVLGREEPVQTSQLPIEVLDLFDCPWGREL